MQENIDDIIKEMRQIRPDCDDCISNNVCDYLSSFADRLDAAYKREVKSMCESWWRDQLIQAGMMESKRKRKRKYEYTAEYVKKRSGKVVSKCVYHFKSFDEAKRFKYYPLKGEKLRFVRRAVGDWEAVPNV